MRVKSQLNQLCPRNTSAKLSSFSFLKSLLVFFFLPQYEQVFLLTISNTVSTQGQTFLIFIHRHLFCLSHYLNLDTQIFPLKYFSSWLSYTYHSCRVNSRLLSVYSPISFFLQFSFYHFTANDNCIVLLLGQVPSTYCFVPKKAFEWLFYTTVKMYGW